MQLKARFTHEKVRFDQENQVHLVISAKAPKLDWEAKRPPVCIIPIIDISGSMGGDKLDYAKKTLLKLIDHLKPGDYCGLGAFESSVHPVQAPIEMTQAQKDALKTKVGDLHVIGSTNFSGGLELGLHWASKLDLPGDVVIRVIMLTDGCANVGVTSHEGLMKIVENRGKASVSCFGYGVDANQELLADLAKKGEGNYAFIKDPEQALTAFGKELGGLLSTYAQNIVIDLAPHNGHKVEEVLSDVEVKEEDKKVIIRLGDLLSEEERYVVLAMKLSVQSQALPRDMNIADIRVEYDLLEGKRTHHTEELKAKLRFVKAGEEQEKPDSELDKIVGLAQLAKAQVEAEEHAKAGNFEAAQNVFLSMENSFQGRGLGGLQALSGNLKAKVGSHAAYTSSQGYLASAKGYSSRTASVSQMDKSLEWDLQKADLGFSMGNAAQCATADSFAEPKGDEDKGGSVFAPWPLMPPGTAPPSVKKDEDKKQKKAEARKKKSVSKSKSGRW